MFLTPAEWKAVERELAGTLPSLMPPDAACLSVVPREFRRSVQMRYVMRTEIDADLRERLTALGLRLEHD